MFGFPDLESCDSTGRLDTATRAGPLALASQSELQTLMKPTFGKGSFDEPFSFAPCALRP